VIRHYRSLVKSVSHAVNGIAQALFYEKNMRTHFVCAITAVLLGMIFGFQSFDWIILTFTISLVFFAELMNTALEAHVDLATKEKMAEAKLAKDVAAGAVLVTSINAVIVGYFLYIEKIIDIIFR